MMFTLSLLVVAWLRAFARTWPANISNIHVRTGIAGNKMDTHGGKTQQVANAALVSPLLPCSQVADRRVVLSLCHGLPGLHPGARHDPTVWYSIISPLYQDCTLERGVYLMGGKALSFIARFLNHGYEGDPLQCRSE